MIGATLCNGALHLRAMRSEGLHRASVTLENIMHINRLIMAPSFVGILGSGTMLAYQLGHGLTEMWLNLSVILTLLITLGFIFGYRLEHQIERSIETAILKGDNERPSEYWQLVRKAAPIGGLATLASIVVLFLMIAKP